MKLEMIQNNYIHELDLDLDIDYLKKLVDRDKPLDGTFKHHRIVANDSYLTEVKNKFPFLSPIFNIYKFEPGKIVKTHIDGDRFCAINIPIYNTEESYTVFYNKDDNLELEYDEQRILHYVKGCPTEAFRFTITKPTLINTTVPHGVVNFGKNTRIIMSWSVLKPLTFEKVKDTLKENYDFAD